MRDERKIQLAQDYCEYYHEGQVRKGDIKLPYSSHPFGVADILARYGYSDDVTRCLALLHDTVEDTPATIDEIRELFGYEIANGVDVLSRNTLNTAGLENLPEEEQYKFRLFSAGVDIRRVKLADTIHNTDDLSTLTKPGSQERKLVDAVEFYIPMGERIAPGMTKELEANIANFRESISV